MSSRKWRTPGALAVLLAVIAGAALVAGCSSEQKPIRVTDAMAVLQPVNAEQMQGNQFNQQAEFELWMTEHPVLNKVVDSAPETLIIYTFDNGGDFERTEVKRGMLLHKVAAVIRHVATDLGTMNKLPRSMNAIQKLAIELMAWIGNDEYARRVYPDGTAGRPVYALAKKPVSTSATTCKTTSPTATSTRSRSTGKPACVK